ncbi:hypothetical protein FOQG_18926 [Fusarium oxysporum f. sp. raphani 54005]|uniref:Hydrophobin 3 n=2 Tax=Fusarium oxysporum f. sp. raphani TaxID=96318 RepID=X0B2J1_FUSOX|nr:hypothetical protein FOQG_18926 [Fusarium oxysporum f. sp. raphani 54005]KAG7420499.1 hypothetical protein Forpi1262_v016194 [Fusarium oxysporum f. sp. raphani]
MKTTALLSALTMAVVAIAAPAEIEARGGGGSGGGSSGGSCNNNQQQVCCNGILGCTVNILGNNCGGNSLCCDTEAAHGTFINVQALNCVAL